MKKRLSYLVGALVLVQGLMAHEAPGKMLKFKHRKVNEFFEKVRPLDLSPTPVITDNEHDGVRLRTFEYLDPNDDFFVKIVIETGQSETMKIYRELIPVVV